jgi:short-subunit dehydrogenase
MDAMRSAKPHVEPRHAVITGASSGVGAALTLVYSEPGRRLSLIARDRDRLEAIAGKSRERGADADVYVADVTNPDEIERVLLTCDSRQSVDLLVANAGIGGRKSLAPDCGEPGFIARQIVVTNTVGVINTVTPILPRLVARRSGQIAIMSSLAGLVGLPACPAYSASKAALRIYGAALRSRVADSGVHVCVICPGFIETPMAATLPFRPPLLWSADRSARYIALGLARRRSEILFPWRLAAAVRLLTFLPAGMVDRILMLPSFIAEVEAWGPRPAP